MAADCCAGIPPGACYAIGLGSNRSAVLTAPSSRSSDLAALIALALTRLSADGHVRVLAQSKLIVTQPVMRAGMPGPPQGDYLNGAAIVATDLGPHQLLHRCQRIEHELGRVRTTIDAARTIDLDLLLRADGLCLASPVLTLPHPRLHQRAFALIPLAEIAATWRHPVLKRSVQALCDEVICTSSG